MLPDKPILYSVSIGDGNDGVSRIVPDYYVKTNNPFHLAVAGLLANFNFATADRLADAVETTGEPDFGVSATLYEWPDGETEFDAAYMICEVYQVEEYDALSDKKTYESLEAAFSVELLVLVREER